MCIRDRFSSEPVHHLDAEGRERVAVVGLDVYKRQMWGHGGCGERLRRAGCAVLRRLPVMAVAGESRNDRRIPDAPSFCHRSVHHVLPDLSLIHISLSADRFVVESTLKFVTMFRDRLMTTGQAKTKGLYLFWTMVDGRERNDLYGIYEEVIAEMGFPVLSTRLPDSKKFRRDLSEERKSVFRSTIFPMDTALLKGSGIREFSEEISDIIRPQ